MNRNYFFWILLITILTAGLIFYTMWEKAQESLSPPETTILHRPLVPFQSYISGTGVVEASSDNISIGIPVNRIVEKVFINVGQEVKKGDILLTLENQDLLADL